MKLKQLTTEWKISAVLLSILLIVASIGILTYVGLSSIVNRVTEASSPDMRLVLTEQLLTNLSHAESSVKSYNLSRDDSYLVPFYRSLTIIDKQVNDLRVLSENDTVYTHLTDSMALLIEQKYAILTNLLGLGNNERVTNELRRIAERAELSTQQALKEFQANTKQEPVKKKGFLRRLFSSKKKKAEESRPRIINPSAQPLINRLQKEITHEVAVVKRAQINQLKDLKQQELLLLLDDRQIMTQIRSVALHMQYLEKKRRLSEALKVSEQAWQTNLSIVLFCVTLGMLLLFTGYLIQAYLRKNRAYTAALQAARNEAEALANAKASFLANMSHEIRTPLNAIAGFTEQLAHQLNQPYEQEQLQIIQNATRHLTGLLNDVLDYSKISAGKFELSKAPFDAARVIAETAKTLEPIAQNKNLHWNIQAGKSVWVNGDALRLRQVLYNLLGNAIKFTQTGGVLLETTSTQTPSGDIVLSITISDTGVGIAKENMERIFNEFEQAHHQRYGGTGLGLSISKKLIELQLGKLELTSTVNKGTSITFSIPYSSATPLIETAPYVLTEKPPYLNGKQLLIADDNTYNRKLLTTILLKWGAVITEVTNGHEAVSAFASGNFDMVLMDIRMPELSGDKALLQIRNLPNGKTTPVIALTASLSPEEEVHLSGLGFTYCLLKPFREQELASAINTLLPLQENSMHYAAKDLNSLGDQLFVKEMAGIFVNGIEKMLIDLNLAMDENNHAALADIAHHVIPSCRHIGANQLLGLLKQLEQSIQQKQYNRLQEQLASINTEARLVIREIKSNLHL